RSARLCLALHDAELCDPPKEVLAVARDVAAKRKNAFERLLELEKELRVAGSARLPRVADDAMNATRDLSKRNEAFTTLTRAKTKAFWNTLSAEAETDREANRGHGDEYIRRLRDAFDAGLDFDAARTYLILLAETHVAPNTTRCA